MGVVAPGEKKEKMYITHIKTPTCLGTEVTSSGIYSNKRVRANLLIYVLFMVISLTKNISC